MERRRLGANGPELTVLGADVEQSLSRLGRDHVDLVHIHDVDSGTPIEESWGELQRLIEEGKVRWAGLSNHTAELVERPPGRVRHVGARRRPARAARSAGTRSPGCSSSRA